MEREEARAELARIKVSKLRTQKRSTGVAWTATLTRDGQPWCEASHDGRGDPVQYVPARKGAAPNGLRREIERLQEVAAVVTGLEFEAFDMAISGAERGQTALQGAVAFVAYKRTTV